MLAPAEVPEVVRQSPLGAHELTAMAFRRKDRRVLPDSLRQRFAAMGQMGDDILYAMDVFSGFLSETFVFDTMLNEEREVIRRQIEAEGGPAADWYDKHYLRRNQIVSMIAGMEIFNFPIEGINVARFLKEKMNIDVPGQVEGLRQDVAMRWGRLLDQRVGFSPERQNDMKKDFLELRMGLMVQDVFDGVAFCFNGHKPIATLPPPRGGISATMREIDDAYRASLAAPLGPDAGMAPREGGEEPER